ncbi:hypothetical protein B0H19DRAFT_1317800 [Mycena capillaripes]|nr:hypothetical protein B0H19DRAFT_1317800 [Mycena capillaripes]
MAVADAGDFHSPDEQRETTRWNLQNSDKSIQAPPSSLVTQLGATSHSLFDHHGLRTQPALLPTHRLHPHRRKRCPGALNIIRHPRCLPSTTAHLIAAPTIRKLTAIGSVMSSLRTTTVSSSSGPRPLRHSAGVRGPEARGDVGMFLNLFEYGLRLNPSGHPTPRPKAWFKHLVNPSSSRFSKSPAISSMQDSVIGGQVLHRRCEDCESNFWVKISSKLGSMDHSATPPDPQWKKFIEDPSAKLLDTVDCDLVKIRQNSSKKANNRLGRAFRHIVKKDREVLGIDKYQIDETVDALQQEVDNIVQATSANANVVTPEDNTKGGEDKMIDM